MVAMHSAGQHAIQRTVHSTCPFPAVSANPCARSGSFSCACNAAQGARRRNWSSTAGSAPPMTSSCCGSRPARKPEGPRPVVDRGSRPCLRQSGKREWQQAGRRGTTSRPVATGRDVQSRPLTDHDDCIHRPGQQPGPSVIPATHRHLPAGRYRRLAPLPELAGGSRFPRAGAAPPSAPVEQPDYLNAVCS